jgi:hypothetical protein
LARYGRRLQLRYTPGYSPECMAMHHFWRHLKKGVLANEPLPNLEKTLKRAWSYLSHLSPSERLQ